MVLYTALSTALTQIAIIYTLNGLPYDALWVLALLSTSARCMSSFTSQQSRASTWCFLSKTTQSLPISLKPRRLFQRGMWIRTSSQCLSLSITQSIFSTLASPQLAPTVSFHKCTTCIALTLKCIMSFVHIIPSNTTSILGYASWRIARRSISSSHGIRSIRRTRSSSLVIIPNLRTVRWSRSRPHPSSRTSAHISLCSASRRYKREN